MDAIRTGSSFYVGKSNVCVQWVCVDNAVISPPMWFDCFCVYSFLALLWLLLGT